MVLSPASKTVKPDEKLDLKISMFRKGPYRADDLASLIPVAGSNIDDSAPLASYNGEFLEFRVKAWTPNGSNAPVSNKYGSLEENGISGEFNLVLFRG